MIEAPADTVLLGRPGIRDRYDWDTKERTLLAFFHFSFDYSEGDWPPLRDWPVSRQLQGEDILRPLFRYVIGLARSEVAEKELLIEAAVSLMLRSFITARSGVLLESHGDLPEPLRRALATIREAVAHDPVRPLTLDELARAAHVSAEYLCRLFRRHLNLGPLECATLARLERGASLLVRSNLTIKQIADTLGFSSPYHFSTKFHQVYGVSPRDYRWSMQSGFMITGNPVIQHLQLHVPADAIRDR
ncbi:MAG: AraC family transcriptional regulator [Verrucomicrobiae bacterium]|nr:AraC family transcriptional regulator [Verrucomicrobiae bacterium]